MFSFISIHGTALADKTHQVGVKIELEEGESVQQAIRRLRTKIRWETQLPVHKRLIKALIRKGEKRRQKRLSSEKSHRRHQLIQNPNFWLSG